ncbi:hypothetical protein BDV59DRAFT_186800 [Aspergillus ambiguus]|uniref:uncharacterized protein n=1 Tax=Aspergillus ambiguus TaxID=176160 RepID=UPI003CCCC76A
MLLMDIRSVLNPLERDTRKSPLGLSKSAISPSAHRQLHPTGDSSPEFPQEGPVFEVQKREQVMSSLLQEKYVGAIHTGRDTNRFLSTEKMYHKACYTRKIPPMAKRPFRPADDGCILFVQNRTGRYLTASLRFSLCRGAFINSGDFSRQLEGRRVFWWNSELFF